MDLVILFQTMTYGLAGALGLFFLASVAAGLCCWNTMPFIRKRRI